MVALQSLWIAVVFDFHAVTRGPLVTRSPHLRQDGSTKEQRQLAATSADVEVEAEQVLEIDLSICHRQFMEAIDSV